MKALTKKIWTYSDYLRIDDDKRYEIIDGRLIEMAGASFEHQSLLLEIITRIKVFVDEFGLGKVIPAPFDVVLSNIDVVQPDIVFISNEKLKMIKGSFFGVPDLVVEIISEGSKRRDKFEKKKLYEKYGVKEYWIANPFDKSIKAYVLNDEGKYSLHLKARRKGKVKSIVLKGFEIDLKEIFV